MCSIGEDDYGDEGGIHAMIPDLTSTKDSSSLEDTVSCIKCNKPGAFYKLPFRRAECRECFLLYARHKFRATLGSSKVMPKDAKVLLVFDGSKESVVLLDMLHHAQIQNKFKRLHCKAVVLYIDDFQLLKQHKSCDDYKIFLEEMCIFFKQYTYFEKFIVPLVEADEVTNCITNIENIEEQNYILQYRSQKQSFLSSINSIKSLTSRQDFLKYHRSKIMDAIAKHFEMKFVFVADITPDLALSLLTAVALGRGGSAALDVALVDDRLSNNIKIIRPLKDLNTTEIELYMEAVNLKPLQTLRYGEEMGSTASLQNLTMCFVENLQQNYSATVSTVYRTGDKIAVNRDITQKMEKLNVCDDDMKTQDECCVFCNSFMDCEDSKTLLAIEFSRFISEGGSSLSYNAKDKESIDNSKYKSYLKKLCHACRNICVESPTENLLMQINKS